MGHIVMRDSIGGARPLSHLRTGRLLGGNAN